VSDLATTNVLVLGHGEMGRADPRSSLEELLNR
jgi:hypothetical protein